MAKYVIRMECLVEICIEADDIEQAKDRVCDLNNDELTNLNKTVTEIYDVVEIEEV